MKRLLLNVLIILGLGSVSVNAGGWKLIEKRWWMYDWCSDKNWDADCREWKANQLLYLAKEMDPSLGTTHTEIHKYDNDSWNNKFITESKWTVPPVTLNADQSFNYPVNITLRRVEGTFVFSKWQKVSMTMETYEADDYSCMTYGKRVIKIGKILEVTSDGIAEDRWVGAFKAPGSVLTFGGNRFQIEVWASRRCVRYIYEWSDSVSAASPVPAIMYLLD